MNVNFFLTIIVGIFVFQDCFINKSLLSIDRARILARSTDPTTPVGSISLSPVICCGSAPTVTYATGLLIYLQLVLVAHVYTRSQKKINTRFFFFRRNKNKISMWNDGME